MSQVGAFPNLKQAMRKTIRGPVNPLDLSTLVSIYPKPIQFKNVTLSPGRWFLPAGDMDNISTLTIGPSSWWRDVGPDEPLIEIVQSSVQIAESLVKDYLGGMFACNMHDSMPGLFFVPGAFTAAEVREKYNHLLQDALNKQLNYWKALIKFGDALWARSNGNPLCISDEMRMAAKFLGSQDKDWMRDHHNTGMIRCFACGTFKNPEYPICQACRSIDPGHPKAKLVQQVPETSSLSVKGK
jgi:hypothetical protein